MKENPRGGDGPAEEFGLPPFEDDHNYLTDEKTGHDGSFAVGDMEEEPIQHSEN